MNTINVYSFFHSSKGLQVAARKTASVLTMIAMVFGSFAPIAAFPTSAFAVVEDHGSKPDLVVVKTNDLQGNAVVGTPFNWILTITNNGDHEAAFGNGDVVLKDNLPSSGASYGPVGVTLGNGVSGNVTCTINVSKDLTCISGSGSSHRLKIPKDKTVVITVPTTPTGTGSLVNPRSSGICAVDPPYGNHEKGNVIESHEDNNTCSNTVTVVNPVGTIEINKYVCPADTSVTRNVNGVGGTVPASCTPQAGARFGYVHGAQTDTNAPYPELAGPFTAAGTTDGSGVLDISGLSTDGRYLIAETNDTNQQLVAGDILGLYCTGDGDTSGINDNQELTFVPANGTVKCVAYNKATPSQIVVHKVINNTGGGAATFSSFSYTVNGGSSVNFDAFGNATTTGVTGSYTVTEDNNASYSPAYSTGCTDGTIAAGETKDCTITNTYIIPAAPSCDAVLSTQLVVSDETSTIDGGTNTASSTYQHQAWTTALNNNGATWIWSSPEVVNPQVGESHTFTKTFTVVGTPTGGSISIAADNGYDVSVNGNEVCGSNTSDPHYATPETCVVPAADLHAGVNTIVVTATNLAYDTTDPHVNPAGVVYQLTINKNACIPQSNVTICKYDDQQHPLSGWTMTLKGDNVEDVTVPTNFSIGTSTLASLTSGVSYIATAVGTWLNQGGANPVDAEYSTINSWTTHMDGYTGYQTDILELQINQAFDPNSNWGAYNAAHTYAQAFTGAGAPANFRIFDGGSIGATSTTPNESWYGDNSGTLAVNISKGYAGITAANGCVTFNAVPTGSYTVGEIMQDGWNNVSGLGQVAVAHATEAFNVVNHFTPPAAQCNPNATSTIVSDVTTTKDGLPAVLVTFIHASWTAVISGASWIWGEDPVADPAHASTEAFTKTFAIAGTPLGATLDLAADNTYAVTVNGNAVCSSNAENNFSATTTCAIPASSLVSGTNTMVFTVTNLTLPADWQGPINGQTNPAGLLYKLTINNNECQTPEASFVKVHLYKYLQTHDGNVAIDTQVPNESTLAPFPMIASWEAANLNGGASTTGAYVLGNYHGQALLKYAADTAAMQAPVTHYASYENTTDTNVLPIAAECTAGKFRLVGYKSSGTSLAAAEGASLQSTAPDFTNFNNDKYVIVVNEDCNNVIPQGPTTGTLTIVKHTIGGDGTFGFNLMATSTQEQNSGQNQSLALTTIESSTSSAPITLTPGTYDVTENALSGWDLTSHSCVYTNESVGVAVAGGEEITLDAGDNVTCTFTNTKQQSGGGETPTFSYSTTTVKAADLAISMTDATSTHPTKWFFYNDNNDVLDNTLGSFVTGPSTAPLGLGSAQITDGAANVGDRTDLATYAFSGTTLASITSLKFSAYSHSGIAGANESPYLVFNVSLNGADTWQKRLVYVPSANGSVPQNAWNTYDTINGGAGLWTWSGFAANGNMWPDSNTSEYRTWSAIKIAFPSAKVRVTDSFMGVRVGEPGPTNYTGNIDNFVIGIQTGLNTDTKTFDFEPTAIETHEDTVTSNTAPQGGGGNGPIGFFGMGGSPFGVVLGASTSTVDYGPQCQRYITDFIKPGASNNPTQVARVQYVLAILEGMNVPQNGIYDSATIAGVHVFQMKYASQILGPWGIGASTGYVYLTTRKMLNEVYCNGATLFPLTGGEQAIIDASRKPKVHVAMISKGSTQASSNSGDKGGDGTTIGSSNDQSSQTASAAAAEITEPTQPSTGGNWWSNVWSFFGGK